MYKDKFYFSCEVFILCNIASSICIIHKYVWNFAALPVRVFLLMTLAKLLMNAKVLYNLTAFKYSELFGLY